MTTLHRTTAVVPATISAWLAYLTVDFLTHAVFLSAWWRATAAYWLPPAVLFKMIPFAYLAFAIYAACLVWLMVQFSGPTPAPRTSLRVGALVGVAFGSTSALANYSVFPMPASMLLVWTGSVTAASLAAAAAGGWTLSGARPWRRVLAVLAGTILLFIVGIVIQNLFFPTPASQLVR